MLLITVFFGEVEEYKHINGFTETFKLTSVSHQQQSFSGQPSPNVQARRTTDTANINYVLLWRRERKISKLKLKSTILHLLSVLHA